MALGRPSECNTFDNLADNLVKAVLVSEKDFVRKDVTFAGQIQENVNQMRN